MENAPDLDELRPPDRTLLGPGPSNVHPRVRQAAASTMVGYLDDYYLDVMADVQASLRYLFQTQNKYTFAVTGSGSAAMETAIGNVVEKDDTVLIPDNGYFGERMGQMAERTGAEVVVVESTWGEPLHPAAVEAAFEAYDPDIFGFVHGETSTGVLQSNVDELTHIAHGHDALVIADTVASLGGVEFRTDEWKIDVAYSGSQKCLSAPPGASPITFSERAVEKIEDRDAAVDSWYLDLKGVWEYWDETPSYHHTGPISTMYALREALRLVAEEGIEERWNRHRHVAGGLKAGVEAMGVPITVDDEYWLPTLNAISVPEGVVADQVIERLMDEHGIEVVGGLGTFEDVIFRVGCMGHSCQPSNVMHFIAAFGSILESEGAEVDLAAGLEATTRILHGKDY